MTTIDVTWEPPADLAAVPDDDLEQYGQRCDWWLHRVHAEAAGNWAGPVADTLERLALNVVVLRTEQARRAGGNPSLSPLALVWSRGDEPREAA